MSWDAQAETLDGARAAVWSEPDYEQSVSPCLDAILVDLPLPPGATVLDLGCGVGRLAVPLAEQHPEIMVIGYDTSARMLAWAAEAAAGLINVRWQLGGMLPRVRCGFSMLTFQHLPPETIVGYLTSLGSGALMEAGRFRFQFVVGDHHEGDDHRYTVEEMAAMCDAASLRVENVTPGLLHEEWAWITAVAS